MAFILDSVDKNRLNILGDIPLEQQEIVLEKIIYDDADRPESKLFLRKTNIEGIYTYGCEQLLPSHFGHEAGYIWASRPSVMNKAFDVCLYEAGYTNDSSRCFKSCAIDLVQFAEILKEYGYEIDFENPLEEEIDRSYKLIKSV